MYIIVLYVFILVAGKAFGVHVWGSSASLGLST